MKPANYAPVYAGLYPALAEIARKHGYAMAIHGSLASDMDLICIPWIDTASDPQVVVDEILATYAIRRAHGNPKQREHGRVVYTLVIAPPQAFVDLSFTPRHLTADVVERCAKVADKIADLNGLAGFNAQAFTGRGIAAAIRKLGEPAHE